MKKMFFRIAVASIALTLGACHSEPTKLATPSVFTASVVPYLDKEVGNEAVQTECDWNRKLPEQLEKESEGQVAIRDLDTPNAPGYRLTLVIFDVHAIGGAGWTGPKWVKVRGQLVDERGRLIGKFVREAHTINGKYRACNTLLELGDEVASDIAEWLKDPKIEPEPKPD